MPVLVVQFTAPWCGPCRPVERALAELRPAFPEVEFRVVDLDADPAEGARHGILALPTVLVVRDGEVVHRLEGARRRDDYERLLREVVEAPE